MNTPKYFENLHLAVSGLQGTPRIVSIDYSKTNASSKYKNIPKKEFEDAVLGYYDHLKENERQLLVLQNWTTVIGANAKDKESLIKILEGVIAEVKDMED